MNRRSFLHLGLGASVATLLPRVASAAATNPVVVLVFMRGGVDPLSMLPPASGTNRTTYLAARPNVRITSPATITNTAGFGIHPSLVNLRALYEASEAAFVLCAGSQNQTRSHFEQMSFIESGDPAAKRTTGYLNRAMTALGGTFALQSVALQDEMPHSLRGPSPAIRIPALDTFGTLTASGMTPGATYMERVTKLTVAPTNINATATLVRNASLGLQSSVGAVRAIVTAAPQVSAATNYGSGTFATAMRDAARIIAAEPRARIIEIDFLGFDTHAMQGNETSGTLRGHLGTLDKALGTFVADAKRLGFWNRTCVVGMSEFGRNVKENGSKGTDHGRGGVAFVAGPAAIVRGKRLLVPANFSLATSALVDGRDLAVTTDVRGIMGEVLTRHLGVPSLTDVFPGYTQSNPGLLV